MAIEKEIDSPSSAETPTSQITEIPEKIRVRKEVSTWLEKVEKATLTLPQNITDDQTGQSLVQPAISQTPKITLPLTRQQIAAGAKKKITEAIRWLSEWCLRIIKLNQGKVAFKKQHDPNK